MELKIEDVALDTIHTDSDNARAHGQKNMASIMGSLRAFSQVEPLVVRKTNRTIIGGNGRYEAMKLLGWKKAQVVFVDLDDKSAAALSIALNRTGELAEWDTSKLRETIIMLQEDAFNLEEIGFDQDDIDRMLKAAQVSGDGEENPSDKVIGEKFLILVTCSDEGQQADLLERFHDEGIDCKALVS